jgi:hypothetical protein
MLLSIVKVGLLAFMVMLAALVTMAWQHQGTAVIGVGTGLVWTVISLGVCLYRLGALSRG